VNLFADSDIFNIVIDRGICWGAPDTISATLRVIATASTRYLKPVTIDTRGRKKCNIKQHLEKTYTLQISPVRSTSHRYSVIKKWSTRETDSISSSLRLGIGSDEFFCLSVSWDDGKGEGARNAKKRKSAVSSSSLTHHQQDAMTVPYAAACKWVRIRSSISAVTFDVENREKRGDNNKEKGIS
jgi:hypothetical protein